MRLFEFGFAQLGTFTEASVGRLYSPKILGTLHIGELNIPIHKHSIDRARERGVRPGAVDVILRKLPRYTEKIQTLESGTKFWVHDKTQGVALGFQKLDSGAIQLNTVMKTDPHEQGAVDVIAVDEETLNAIPTVEMAGEIHRGVSEYLSSKGYQYLGGGIDKQAYSEPKTGQVLIVFGYRKGFKDFSPDQRMFIDWINYCNKNRNNPNLPKFSGFESFRFHGQNYIQARMEHLEEAPEQVGDLLGFLEDAIDLKNKKGVDFEKTVQKLSNKHYYDEMQDEVIRYQKRQIIQYLGGARAAANLLNTVKQVMLFGRKHGFDIDLHRGNYMQRDGRTIVVNDPFVIWMHRL